MPETSDIYGESKKKVGEVVEQMEYERVVTKYMDTVYRIAISYTKSPNDADDVVQQTFMKLLTKKVTFTDEEHIKRWLIRVCINECNNLFSSFWRKNVGLFQEEEELVFTMEEHSDLFEAIKKLPAKCRIVVYLFYYEGYSTKEIGEMIHVREATVRTRLVRARKLLKAQLKEAWDYEE